MQKQPSLIPLPQSMHTTGGAVPLGRRGEVPVRIEGPEPDAGPARVAAGWVAEAVGIAPPEVTFAPAWRLVLGTDAPPAAAPAGEVPAHAAAAAYRLVASGGGATVAAGDARGILAGAATLLQLLPGQSAICDLQSAIEILDYPDVPWRVASHWLLNVEINRWSYDWGDGPEAFEARVCRALDRAARHKINGVIFDGFGWDAGRTPGYAPLMRRLNRYARDRGIRLQFGGYMGGYGFAYQSSVLYRAPYLGRVVENRDPYPDGPLYRCFGDLRMPASRELGTCCANDAQNAAKADELADFVARVHPGALYLHHTDSGDFSGTAEGWRHRCPRCRDRWPSDALAAPDGGAGGLAHLFRALAERINNVPSEEGYVPARDCLLLFTGPAYSHYQEHDAKGVWAREVEFFTHMSRLLADVPNARFVIREQFRTAEGEQRVAQLAEALRTQGGGHGVTVIWFGGGDRYLNDNLTAASTVLAPFNAGAAGVSFACGHAQQWPQQLVNADLLWNLSSPLAETAQGYDGAIARFQELVPEALTPAMDAFLDDACARLFGSAAAPALASLYRLRPAPVSTAWWTLTAEVARWQKEFPPAGRAEHWSARAESTRRAQELVAQALADGVSPDMRPEVEWLALGLRAGGCFAALLAALYAGEDTSALLAETRAVVAAAPRDFVDPLGGDIGCWEDTLAAIEERV